MGILGVWTGSYDRLAILCWNPLACLLVVEKGGKGPLIFQVLGDLGLRFKVEGLGFSIYGLEFRIEGLGFRV